MSHTHILSGVQLLDRMEAGAKQLADAVGATLGPAGRNVIVPDKAQDTTRVTKDGVTVAVSMVSLQDPFENISMNMVKKAAQDTASEAGDGTTSSTILAHQMLSAGVSHLKRYPNANVTQLSRGIQDGVKMAVGNIYDQAIEIGDDISKLIQVATTSANNDAEIGKLVGEAAHFVGLNSLPNYQPSHDGSTYKEDISGYSMPNGAASTHFYVNNSKQLVLHNPLIVLLEQELTDIKEAYTLLQIAQREKRSLLILASDITGEALPTLTLNHNNGAVICCAVKIPAMGSGLTERLKDLQAAVGGTVIGSSAGNDILMAKAADFGTALKVIVSRDKTIIVGGNGNQDLVNERMELIRSQMDDSHIDDQSGLARRLAALSARSCTIYVGGFSVIEIKEKMDRVDDAIKAARSAMQEGILPGGGSSYIIATSGVYAENSTDRDYIAGVDIVRQVGNCILRKICSNAGVVGDRQDDIVNQVFSGLFVGYNAKTGEIEDLVESGVIDPAKVTRVALENAGSIASTLLTTAHALYYGDTGSNNIEVVKFDNLGTSDGLSWSYLFSLFAALVATVYIAYLLALTVKP